jgi:integrase
MARKARNSTFETRTARLKLAVRLKPYTAASLARGIKLLYRRNKYAGTWVVKVATGVKDKPKDEAKDKAKDKAKDEAKDEATGDYWTKRIGTADDFEDADGKTILTFYQAQDRAKEFARSDDGASSDAAPVTVDTALTDYAADLAARNAGLQNARWPRRHLPPVLLAKPVQLLTTRELRKWRDGLLGTISPASVNRLCNCVCAALELAAQHDERIKNRDAWETGLEGLPDAQTARNVVLPDDKVHAFVDAAYARDAALGLLVDVLAITGARPSQAVRLCCEDVHEHPSPKLMMPKSGKGGGRNRAQKRLQKYSVPITAELARRLKQAAAGRAPDAPLLVRGDGTAWPNDPSQDYRGAVRAIIAGIGEDPDKVTVYALRHSSIVRMLKAVPAVPIRYIAALHNTSVGQIERNYSANITEQPDIDAIARVALLRERAPVAANLIPLTR